MTAEEQQALQLFHLDAIEAFDKFRTFDIEAKFKSEQLYNKYQKAENNYINKLKELTTK